MMWIILFTNVILLFRNVILQTKTIILLSTKIISLAKIIQNKITLKSTLHSLTFNFATVLFTNRKSDFLQWSKRGFMCVCAKWFQEWYVLVSTCHHVIPTTQDPTRGTRAGTSHANHKELNASFQRHKRP